MTVDASGKNAAYRNEFVRWEKRAQVVGQWHLLVSRAQTITL
jgi:hypothetical protein